MRMISSVKLPVVPLVSLWIQYLYVLIRIFLMGPDKLTLIFMWKGKSSRIALKALKVAATTKHIEGKFVLPDIKALECYSNLTSVALA